MRNNFYILATKKTLIKKFFEDKTWSWKNITSVIVEGENGKTYQIFGAKANYGEIGSIHRMYHDQSGRYICVGKIVRYSDNIEKNTNMFVFK